MSTTEATQLIESRGGKPHEDDWDLMEAADLLAKRFAILRAAVVGLVGSDDREELEQMEMAIRIAPVPECDKAASINAIRALLETI